MKNNFQNCLELTLQHEGGYVNHPKDPGGATNFGVTQATYNAYRKKKGLARQSVKFITRGEVEAIYRSEYWWKVGGDHLPFGLDNVTFDASVNSGVGRGPKWTQRALGVAEDGKVGPQTLTAALNADVPEAIKKACAYRLGFLKGLRHWSTFGRGWTRRVHEVEASSLAMVVSADHLREEAKISKAKVKKESSGAGGSVLGGISLDVLSDFPFPVEIAVGVALGLVAFLFIYRALSDNDRAKAMLDMAETIVEFDE